MSEALRLGARAPIVASTQQAATKEVAALPLLAAAAGGQEGRGKLEGGSNNSCAESISTPRIMTMDASNEEYVLSSKIYHDDAQQPADAARPPADAKQPPEGLDNCGVGN